MKKNVKKLLLFIAVVITAVVCFTFSASARSFTAGGKCGSGVQWLFYESSETLVIERTEHGSGEMYSYDFESNLPSYAKYKDQIKKVVIRDGVVNIGKYTFCGFAYIESLIIANSVECIGSYAFYGCSSLTSITIPDSVTTIDKDAFKNCSSVEMFVLGDKIEYIGDGVFDGCMALKEIHLPASLKSIGDTFYGCSGLAIYYAGDIYQWMNVEGWETVSDYFSVNTQPHIHTEITVKGKAATCKATGLTDGKKCTVCSVMTVPQKTIAKLAHKYSNNCDTTCNNCSAKRTIKHTYSNNCDTTCNVCSAKRTIKHTYSNNCDTTCNVCKAKRSITHSYKATTTKATLSKNGKVVNKCTVCGYSKTTTVYYPKTIKLEYTSATYNGKKKTPSVTVKDSKGNKLKKDTDYTVKYASGRKSTGKYTVTVTFKGKYSGTKKLTFTIVPKAVTLSKVTAGSKSATVAWKTTTGASGYQVMYSTSSKFKSAKTATVSGSSSKKTTIKKLTKGKKYYFKVRAYKTVDSTKIYGAWSSVKNVKVK